MTIHIGIDAGLKGALALLNGHHAKVIPMPVSGGEIEGLAIAKFLESALSMRDQNPIVWLEKVHSMPKQGVSSTFKFGKGYGTIIGVCQALRISLRFVTPQAWKQVVLAGTAKDKFAAIAYCDCTWPDVSLVPPGCRKQSDGAADALCIAKYGQMQP